MKLKLVGSKQVQIAGGVGLLVNSGETFEVEDKTGESLLVQGIFEKVGEDDKKNTK